MNVDTLINSLSLEDLQAILRSMNEGSTGSRDELMERLRHRSEGQSWKYLLLAVPKEGLQRICQDNGLRSDLPKDELIEQIAASVHQTPSHKGLLRDLGSPWMRWTMPGQRGRGR